MPKRQGVVATISGKAGAMAARPAARRASALLLAGVLLGLSAAAHAVDSDRVEGTGKQVQGNVEEKAGDVTGDQKLEAQGQADQSSGKAEDAWGKVKDAVREVGSSIETMFHGK